MVRISFGLPEHGWLPVRFEAGDFTLKTDASDVPINPLDDLCSALTIALRGGTGTAGWHLEPAWYYFRFEAGENVITLCILEDWKAANGTVEKFRLVGTFESIVLPFY